MLEKVIEDWTTSEPAVAVVCQKSYLKFRLFGTRGLLDKSLQSVDGVGDPAMTSDPIFIPGPTFLSRLRQAIFSNTKKKESGVICLLECIVGKKSHEAYHYVFVDGNVFNGTVHLNWQNLTG
ncbi:hypothetical protein TNCV_1776091 [Trichonephila clavipes]|nr:hypothetical protein TNCV_1776091 [Trichonephila clavipes]